MLRRSQAVAMYVRGEMREDRTAGSPARPGSSTGGVAPASSEFRRVLPGFLFKGYLCCFLQLRVAVKVKRIKAMGEVPG